LIAIIYHNKNQNEGGNMANYGFSHVQPQGYISFAKELEEGDWKTVLVSGFEVPYTEPLPVGILIAPKRVAWKVRLSRCIEALNAVLQRNAGSTPSLVDPRWDAAQTQLRSLIVAAIQDEDPQIQAAGQRLFKALLLGESGLGQNQLVYQKEVDHGVMQVTLAGQAPLSVDVQLLGLEKCIARIERVTKELSDALGRAPGQTSQLAADRAEFLRQALVTANESFNAVLGDIDWHIENLVPNSVALGGLRAPLQALLERYSAPRPAPITETNNEKS
jgi:hypothetical protein